MAMARQQELISDESPKEGINTDNNALRTESKRKKFRPFRAVRNMFRKRMRRQGSENLQDYKKSRSTTELQSDQEGSRRFSSPNSSYTVGLSVSHDSIFSPDHVTTSLDPQELRNIHGFLSVQHVELKDLKTELFARVRARRDSDDEDAGLPHSPCTSPTTADILSQNLKSKGGISHTTCSAGSLISMGSSENDEDLTGQTLSSHSSRMSLSDRKFADSDDADVSQSVPLSHKAARHKIAVRPKRTHGLPRHRKQQLAASGLGSLPSTPEISEDSGRPSSDSLQSSKIFFDEFENSSEGINMEFIPTSPIFNDMKSENMILSDSSKSSPESPEENSISQISNTSNNSNQDMIQNLLSPLAVSPKWNITESLDSTFDKLEKECILSDSENIEKNSYGCNEINSEINIENYNDNNTNNSEEKNGKEAKEVFALWGVKMRRNSDIEKNEKYVKEEKDDQVIEEPFLSRWFGSRRSSHKIKKNNDNECVSSHKETNEHVLNDSSKSPRDYNICDGMNSSNKIEKKNLFLNLNSSKVSNEQTFKHFISHAFQSSQNEKHLEQSTTPKFKLEYGFKQVSSTTSKQVVKSSSDNCVNYSLISNTKDQRESKNYQNKEVKTSENSPQTDKESFLSKTSSNFTTWADLKRVQKEKQESTYNLTQNNANEEVQEKNFEIENISKESQDEISSPSNLTPISTYKNSITESNVSQQKQNLKNTSTFKEESSLTQTDKETKESESEKVELILNEEQSKAYNTKNQNSLNKLNGENSDNNVKRSPNQKTDNVISPIRTWQDSINVLDSNNITNQISSAPNHEVFSEITSNNKTAGTNNSKYKSKEIKSTNSISKADLPQFAITSNSNILKTNTNEMQTTTVRKITENAVQTNQINKELVSPKNETELKKEVNGKHFQETHTSLPQNSELFHVFARRSIKQKHIDKEKSKNSINDSSNGKSVKNNLNTENTSNSILKDSDKNIPDSKFQKEKNNIAQDTSLVSNGVNMDNNHSGEINSEVKTAPTCKSGEKDTNQDISSRPRSNTNTDSNSTNNSVSEMRTRKASVPESTKKSFLKNKQDSCDDVKTPRSVNERDKSKSFKLSNSRNSSQDTKGIEENQQPAWLRLAQQRREQREQKEKQLYGSSSPSGNENNGKPSRSTKVLDMVSNFQKLQMT
ncbi:putative uncharacterized protein DDB_G0282133 isoform X2 [Centruroides sculpturatus]|uniref:putative uncharacterized protein DDB_G0282133 isoform X1 n=1 Tax=Centruroides sculpturatus TaxID=218467 RepID=UPI000C6E44B6|nr:putative uncharacterized protein DDB_G0282133 isoform X1 [Centruroides sculpturatus]XP_023216079.1 putative uncharacterized protein DDB_G0282133 isoform X2 [Centruroides sculpturatus]